MISWEEAKKKKKLDCDFFHKTNVWFFQTAIQGNVSFDPIDCNRVVADDYRAAGGTKYRGERI